MTATLEMPAATHALGIAWVHLGENEWGNETMERVANEMADSRFADVRPLLLTVYEHGGWFLQFFYDDRHRALCVGTANDCARFQSEAVAVIESIRRLPPKYLGSIRRK